MSDDIRQLSLFESTSAFDRPAPALPSPEELADRISQTPVPDYSQRLARVAELIEDALAAATDTDLIPILHEALEEARA